MSVASYQRARAAASDTDGGDTPTTGNTAPTLDAVKLALRIDEDDLDDVLTRNIEVALTLANEQAPSAPEAIVHEAIIRACGWFYEAPQVPDPSWAGIWHLSGAKGLLSRWTIRRGGVIG